MRKVGLFYILLLLSVPFLCSLVLARPMYNAEKKSEYASLSEQYDSIMRMLPQMPTCELESLWKSNSYLFSRPHELLYIMIDRCSLFIGMTTQELKEKLGEPDFQTTDKIWIKFPGLEGIDTVIYYQYFGYNSGTENRSNYRIPNVYEFIFDKSDSLVFLRTNDTSMLLKGQ